MATLLLPESTPELRARNLAKKIRDTGFLWQDGPLIARYNERPKVLFNSSWLTAFSKYYGTQLMWPNGPIPKKEPFNPSAYSSSVEFTPLSDELCEKLTAYYKLWDDTWQETLRRNGY